MSRNLLVRGVALMMAVLLPMSMMAADVTRGMLHARGAVTLNGNKAPASSAVFAGDTLRTAADAAASISARGSQILLAANTSAVLGDNALQLDSGSAVVTTSTGMTAGVRDLTIGPAKDDTARYLIEQAEGRVKIAALEGGLAIRNGSETTTLAAGRVLTFEPPTTTAAPAPSKPASNNMIAPGVELLIMLGIIAGTAATIGIVNAVRDDDESPVTP
jgi:hypothetical protein